MATDNVRIVFDDNLSELTSATIQYRNELVKNKKTQDELYKAGKIGAKEYLEALNQIDNETNKLDRDTKKLTSDMSDGMEKSGKGATALSNTMGSLKGMIAGAFAVSSLVSFGAQIFETTKKFQSLQTRLNILYNDTEVGALTFKRLSNFAKESQFQLDELVAGYIKLANQGFKPTNAELKKLGDLAGAMGKTFDQLSEAIIDAQTGEFERLKEFGIKASVQGDKVAFTFRGVTTEVDKSNEAIRAYILSLGDLEGISGGTATQMGDLAGQVSNLSDTWDAFIFSFSSGTESIASKGIKFLNNLIVGAMTAQTQLKLIWRQISSFGQQGLESFGQKELMDVINFGVTESGKAVQVLLKDLNNKTAEELSKNKDYYLKLIQDRLVAEGEAKGESLAIAKAYLYDRSLGLEAESKESKMRLEDEQKAVAESERKKNEAIRKEAEKRYKEYLKHLDDKLKAENDALKKANDVLKKQDELEKSRNELRFELSKQQIDEINKNSESEVNIVKQKFINNEISAEEYYAELERLELERLTNIGKNSNVEIAERKKANQKILDDQLKNKQDFDKEFADLVKEQDDAQAKEDAKKKKSRVKTKEEKEAEDRAYTDFAIDSAEYTANQLLEIQERKNQEELDKQMAQSEKLASNAQSALQNQLSEGVITQETFNKLSEQVEAARLAREAKIKQDAWIKERNAQLIQIGINTAVGVSKVIAQTGVLSPAAIIPIIGLGALQAAFVLAQPVPKFAKGGYTGKGGNIDETGQRVAGVVHDGEWVAPKSLVASQKPLIEHLENIRTGKTSKKLVGDYNSIMVNDNTQVVKAIQRNKVVSLDDKTIKKLTQSNRRTHLK